MPISFEIFLKNANRMRALMDYIEGHLDEELRLVDLAGMIELSPTHFVRTYSRRVGETPMQTLRRLRLKRAHERILAGRFRSLTDVGFDAGYGSSAAFTHAFMRQFGVAPSEIRLQALQMLFEPPLQLILIPERKVWQFRYTGHYADNGHFKTRLAWRYYLAGGKKWRGWRLNDQDHPFAEVNPQRVDLTHFLPVSDSRLKVEEADLVTMPGGLYAAIEISPQARETCMPTLPERIRFELGCEMTGGRMIEYDKTIRDYCTPKERRIVLHVPVVPVRGLRQ